jgi:dTDP-4-dehydrorhamnose 3,5-epimerase
MGSKVITDLIVTPLKQISDERGAVFHFLKSDSSSYKNFGEAYFSKINEGVVKGWKLHFLAQQNFCVPYGVVKLVIFDNRKGSETKGLIQEIIIDDSSNYNLVSFPSNLYYSFKCLSKDFAILANISSEIHDPKESIILPHNNDLINYQW